MTMSPPKGKTSAESEMTVQVVADYLHWDYLTVFRFAQQGHIPGFKQRGRWRFLKSDIDNWIVNRGGSAPRKQGPCQGNGCASSGSMRSDMYQKRTLFLCNRCFESLQVCELKQLFKEIGLALNKCR